MQQNVVTLLQLLLRDSRQFPHLFDGFPRQRHHVALSALLQVRLHCLQRSQQAAVEDVADEGAFFARILHRQHRERALLAALPRKRRIPAGIGLGEEAGERGVEKSARNESENAPRVPLLLEGRENQNLAEAKRVRRGLEGVGEDVEKTKARQTGVLVHGGVEGEDEPAMRRVLGDHDFAGAVDEPVAERLDVFEELDGAGRGQRVEIEGKLGGVRGVGLQTKPQRRGRRLDLGRKREEEEGYGEDARHEVQPVDVRVLGGPFANEARKLLLLHLLVWGSASGGGRTFDGRVAFCDHAHLESTEL